MRRRTHSRRAIRYASRLLEASTVKGPPGPSKLPTHRPSSVGWRATLYFFLLLGGGGSCP